MAVEIATLPAAGSIACGSVTLMDAWLAPLVGILAPRRAARTMLAASPVGLWTAVIAYAALLGVTAAFVYVGYIVDQDRIPAAEAWRVLHPDGNPGRIELVFGLMFVVGLLLPLLFAALWLPGLSPEGSIARGLQRGFRAASAVMAWTVLSGAGLGGLMLCAMFLDHLLSSGFFSFYWQATIPTCVFPALVWLLIYRLSQVMAVARERGSPRDISPFCEGCGYSLAVLPRDGRCPECGLALAESLERGLRRPGSRWQRNSSPRAWLADAGRIINSPRPFYGALKLRDGLHSFQSFAVWNYLAISLGAWLWAFEMICLERFSRGQGFAVYPAPWTDWGFVFLAGPLFLAAIAGAARLARMPAVQRHLPPAFVVGAGAAGAAGLVMWTCYCRANYGQEFLMVPTALALWAPLVCWSIQRAVATVATGIAFWRGMLPDGGWAEKVANCEAVVMWAFCAWWGLIGTSLMMAHHGWMTELLGQRFCYDVFGMEAEPAAMLYGALLLALLALLRYRIAFQAARWANY